MFWATQQFLEIFVVGRYKAIQKLLFQFFGNFSSGKYKNNRFFVECARISVFERIYFSRCAVEARFFKRI